MVGKIRIHLKFKPRSLLRNIYMQNDTFISSWNKANRVRLQDLVVISLCIVILPSGVIQGLLGLDQRSTFVLVTPIMLCLFLVKQNDRIHKSIPPLALALALTGVVASIISMAMSQLLMAISLVVAVLVGFQLFLSLSRADVLRIVSYFTLVLLVGGLIGILYAMVGGSPLFESQVGYRTTYLYLTTFSFAFVGDIIRPSAIFDEPGAFAMFVTIVTMFNDSLRQNRKLNNALIVLLVFTGSLSGLLTSALYLIASHAMRAQLKRNIVIVAALCAGFFIVPIVAPSNPISQTLDTFYGERFVIEDGRLVGDNRSNQVDEFFEIVDDQMLLEGVKNRGIGSQISIDQSSNPFSIIFGYGFIIWLPFAILLLWLIFVTFQYRFYSAYSSIGMLLLLLQRPYLYNMYWSIMIMAAIWLIYNVSHKHSGQAFSAR